MFGVCVRRGSVRAAARVVYRPGVRAATGGNSGAAGATAPWRRAGAALGAVGLAGGVAAMVGWQQNQETPAPLGMHLRPTVAECEESPAKIHRVRDAVPDVGVVIEPGTGLPFAEQVYESGSTQRLVGLGCRNKYYFLSVYAVALYVDEQDAAALQARTGEEWLQRLLTGGARCQLRIKFYRGVGRDEMIKAIEDSIRPRLSEQAKDELRWLTQTLAEKANLNGGYIMEGTEIVFNWNAYSLCVRINDTTPRCLVVTELGRALFDVYVGEKPISSSAWASFVKGAKELYC